MDIGNCLTKSIAAARLARGPKYKRPMPRLLSLLTEIIGPAQMILARVERKCRQVV